MPMILEKEIKDQLIEYLKLMEGNVVIKLSTGSDEAPVIWLVL
jgi:hypothetical protein